MNDSKKSKRKRVLTEEQKLKRAASTAAWRAANPEKVKATRAAYYAAHREKKKAYQADYTANHRAEKKAYAAAYYAAHREEAKAYNKVYYVASYSNKPFWYLSKSVSARHRQRDLGHLPSTTPEEIEAVWKECDGECTLCGITIQIQHPGGRTHPNAAHLDCVVPSKGYIVGNMTFLCAPCNRMKGAHTAETATRLAAFLIDWENQCPTTS